MAKLLFPSSIQLQYKHLPIFLISVTTAIIDLTDSTSNLESNLKFFLFSLSQPNWLVTRPHYELKYLFIKVPPFHTEHHVFAIFSGTQLHRFLPLLLLSPRDETAAVYAPVSCCGLEITPGSERVIPCPTGTVLNRRVPRATSAPHVFTSLVGWEEKPTGLSLEGISSRGLL